MARRVLLLVDGSPARGRGLPRSPPLRGLGRAPAGRGAGDAASGVGRGPRRPGRRHTPAPAHGLRRRRRAQPLQSDTDRDRAGAAPPHDRSRSLRPRPRRSRGSTESCSSPRDGAGPTWKTCSGGGSSRTRWGTWWGMPASSRSSRIGSCCAEGARPSRCCSPTPRNLASLPHPPGVQSPEAGGAGRPAAARPPVSPPAPTTGIRPPGRPRPAMPPPPPPSTEAQEQPTEEE